MADMETGAAGEVIGRAPDVAVRERLLACATALFTRKGYVATTVREIVAAAGVTKPVLYYYFRNKEGIYLELMSRPFATFTALVDGAIAPNGTARERIARLVLETYSLFVSNIDLARLMYAIYYGPPQGAPFLDFDAYHERFRNAVTKLVAEGIERGEIRTGNVAEIAWAIIGVANIAMEIELCHPELGLGEPGLGRLLDLVFGGISAESDGAKGETR